MKFFKNIFFVFGFLYLFFFSQVFAREKSQKLILHFDVNRTIIAIDPKGGRSLSDVLNYCLSEKYTYQWEENIKKPISYYTYVYEYLLPGKLSDRNLKRKRTEKISSFLSFLYEKEHPLYTQIKKEYDLLMEKLKGGEIFIFPSFFLLLDKLEKKEIDFHLILRSFGSEIQEVIREIEKRYPSLKFSCFGQFKKRELFLPKENKKIQGIKNIYNIFTQHKCISIQDDYFYWNSHEEKEEYGKMFPLNIFDKTTLSLFFDDHIIEEIPPPRNIVAPFDIMTENSIPLRQMIQEKKAFFVDTIQAILDDRYFIRRVKEAIDYKKN